MRFALLLSAFVCCLNAWSQDSLKVDIADEIFTIVQDMPEFPGGMAAFYEEVSSRVNLPQKTNKKRIQGRVYVTFVVNRDGEMSQIQVVKGIGYGCDEEAESAMKEVAKSHRWIGGKHDGKPVAVKMVLPIMFNF